MLKRACHTNKRQCRILPGKQEEKRLANQTFPPDRLTGSFQPDKILNKTPPQQARDGVSYRPVPDYLFFNLSVR